MAEQKESKGSNKVMTLLVVILTISNLVTLYLLFTSHQENVAIVTQNTDLTTEKDELTLELEQMLAEYDSVSTDNEEMKEEIAEQRAQIEELLAKAEKHKNDAWTIHKLRKEAATLRDIMKSYLVTIDSLNTANQDLIVQKAKVETQLTSKSKRTSN